MIGNLFAILALFFIAFVFWQQRRQAELAKVIAAKKCKQLDLQLLNIALKKHSARMLMAVGIGTLFINLNFLHLVMTAIKDN